MLCVGGVLRDAEMKLISYVWYRPVIPATWLSEAGSWKFKILLGYKVSSRAAWAIW